MFNEKLILTLLNINGVGLKTVNKLIKHKLPEDLDSTTILNFVNNNKIKSTSCVDILDIITAKQKCNKIIKICEEKNINIITILDEKFPGKLKTIKHNPVLLYYKGDFSCVENNKSIALVGSRTPTLLSQQTAYKIGQILVEKGFVVISGLALGCDTMAHKSAVNNYGKTVAVMPCSLDKIYPKTNKNLLEDILKSGGCVISEYSPNTSIYKNQFIERDRLQSALSLGIIVVETTQKGGTMHTVDFALKQNKLVACCKNKINNHLEKNKKIYIIEDMKSLEKFLELSNKKLNENHTEDKNIQLKFKI